MTDITIPPLIYFREAGRTIELCIKPQDGCLQTYTLTEPQFRQLSQHVFHTHLARMVDVKV